MTLVEMGNTVTMGLHVTTPTITGVIIIVMLFNAFQSYLIFFPTVVTTALVTVGTLGVIAVLTVLVYWPLPRKYQHDNGLGSINTTVMQPSS